MATTKHFNWGWLCGSWGRIELPALAGWSGWIRFGVCGPGLSLRSTPPTFSERSVFHRPIARWGKWRLIPIAAMPVQTGDE